MDLGLMCIPVGLLKHFSWVVLMTTLGDFLNMQIRPAIMKEPIFFNIFRTMHDRVTNLVSRPMFSWSRNKIKACTQCLHVQFYLYMCDLHIYIPIRLVSFIIVLDYYRGGGGGRIPLLTPPPPDFDHMNGAMTRTHV